MEKDAQRMRDLLERTSELAIVTDADMKIRYISPQLAEEFGFAGSVDELLGQDGWAFIHPDDVARMRLTVDRIVATPGARERVQFKIYRGDGSVGWVDDIITNLLDDEVVHGIMFTIRDVTEERRTVEELRSSEQFLRSVLDAGTARCCAAL